MLKKVVHIVTTMPQKFKFKMIQMGTRKYEDSPSSTRSDSGLDYCTGYGEFSRQKHLILGS
jgi:hypothetical protein